MSLPPDTIDHKTLQRMQAAGVVTDVLLVAEPEGWACVVKVRRTHYPLRAKRGGVRHWSRMESAARYLRALGIGQFRVDARALPPPRTSGTRRPDAAAKLKRTHEAAAYDTWFREEVAAGLKDIAAGRVVSHEEVEAEFAARRAEAQRRLDADA